MNTNSYEKILEEFCKAAHLDEPEKFIETGQLWIDELPINFHYFLDQEFEAIQIFIDIAEIHGSSDQYFRRLLEFNFLVHRYGTGLVCIEPGSDRLSYVITIRIEMSLTGGALAEILDKGITQACWIKDNYLSNQTDEKKSSNIFVPLA
jgi:hypothetical protein